MKKIVRTANIIISLFLVCVTWNGRADINNGNNGLSHMIAELQPYLTQEQKKQVHDEVMGQEIIQFLDLGDLSSKGSSTYEIVTGFIDEAIKKVVPAKEVKAQSDQMIFNAIKVEKGSDALPSVKAVLRHLHAQPLEYIKNVDPLDQYDLAVIRIKVPSQIGQTCGIHALANLLTVQKVITFHYVPQRADFTRLSENVFKKQFKSCPKELVDVNVVADNARKIGLSEVILVGVDETKGDEIYTYPIVGQQNFAKLLQDFIDGKIPVLNIIVHSKTKKPGSHAEHWAAASIISKDNPLIDGIQDSVVVYMNSIGNEPFVPTNNSVKKALRHLSRQITDAYDVPAYEDIEDVE